MAVMEQTTGDGPPEPGPHPGRDLPPPPIDEPPGDTEPDQPPVREPPLRPEGNPPQIAREPLLTSEREMSDGLSG